MSSLPKALESHRVSTKHPDEVCIGRVRYAPVKSLWFLGMCAGAIVGGALTFSPGAFALYVGSTAIVLLFGHSLGSHRKLIHDSYQCPKWMEYLFVYCGVMVGLDGPLGLMRQHELRDYAQRLPNCHDYLRHGSSFWRDGWWQLNCSLRLAREPLIRLEPRIADDAFYRFLQRTWMLQQLPWALLFYAWGGWGFVFWGVCARVMSGVGGHWLIGYFAHNHGRMHYSVRDAAVQGRNIPWTSLLTMGESWHNNHHAFPGSAKLGLQRGEWDPGWWVLQVLHRCKLVWNLRLPGDLPHRPELEELRSPRERLTVREAFRLANTIADESLALRWPARRLSGAAMRRLVSGSCSLTVDPAMSRLTLFAGNRRIQGAPAVYLALAHRCGLARRLAWLMVPPALAVERFRASFA
jgi:fatty-acid desaturase